MSIDTIYIATDGACCLNGKRGSKAGWGVYINKNTYAYGPVPSTNLILSESINKPGRLCLVKGKSKVDPTNNRGELLAIVIAYLMILEKKIPKAKKYVIISDSKYSIRTINEWLDKWSRLKIVHTKKNTDLLEVLIDLKKRVDVNIEFQFQRSHQKDTSGKRNKFEELNYQADKLAELGENSVQSVFKFGE